MHMLYMCIYTYAYAYILYMHVIYMHVYNMHMLYICMYITELVTLMINSY